MKNVEKLQMHRQKVHLCNAGLTFTHIDYHI